MERTYIENKNWCRAEEEDEEEEEALSLSDLPLIHHQSTKENDGAIESQDVEFDFCSLSKEFEMCVADEVFFQGQIMPLRHSISSEKGWVNYSAKSISRSESMDRFHSSGFISSRSSSSSSSKSKPGLPTRIQFHSHPSPSPRIQGSISGRRSTTIRKSSMWNIFRIGLVQPGPPEIAFQNLKARRSTSNISTNCRNFGSRNSSNSSGSSKRYKARMLLGGSGCACSYDAVDTVGTKVATIKRSVSERRVENSERKPQATKKQLSHHRTFEWLKQLSLEATSD